MIEIIPLFPTLVVKINTKPSFDNIKESILDYAYTEMKNDPGVIKSNDGGWQSKSTIGERSDFLVYKNFLLDQSQIALSKIFINGLGLGFDNCWFNCNRKGDANGWHNHPPSDIAGCLWLKTSEKCGSFMAQSSNAYQYWNWTKNIKPEVAAKYNFSDQYYFGPTEGELILFPGSTYHKVRTSESDEDRISIAFNLRILKTTINN